MLDYDIDYEYRFWRELVMVGGVVIDAVGELHSPTSTTMQLNCNNRSFHTHTALLRSPGSTTAKSERVGQCNCPTALSGTVSLS